MNELALIYVVDDDESLRTALLRLLRAAGFEARGFGSVGDFLLHSRDDRPTCLLLDVRMPGPSGLDLQAALQRQGNAPPIIFLTGHADVRSSVAAMKAGAVDYLTKPVQRETLLEALKRALERDAVERSTRAELEGLRTRFASLTPREREVLADIVSGKLNKQIAYRLDVSERTIKLERARIMDKLGAGSAAELGRLVERVHGQLA